MKVGSLFAGIGGFDLGLERAGMEVVWQVEFDPYCNKVLAKHWPSVKRYGDIYEVNTEELEKVDVICGGFPCQPFSHAGKRRGKSDNRYLWPEMFRIIKDLKPTWVIGENVAGIVNMALDTVLLDLEAAGYEVWTFIIPAAAVGAPHQRKRVWIIAYRNPTGQSDLSQEHRGVGTSEEERVSSLGGCSDPRSVAHSDSIGYPRSVGEEVRRQTEETSNSELSGGSETRRSLSNSIRPGDVADSYDNGCPTSEEQGSSNERSNSSKTRSFQTSKSEGPGEQYADVADTAGDGCKDGCAETRREVRQGKQGRLFQFEGEGQDVAYAEQHSERTAFGERSNRGRSDSKPNDGDGVGDDFGDCGETFRQQWEFEPDVGRVAHGVPSRVDRLKCLGNAVVPQVVEAIGRMIMDIETGGSSI